MEEVSTILVAYPKSGSTWLKFLLCNLLRPDTEHDFTTTTRLIPCLGTPEMENSKRFLLLRSHLYTNYLEQDHKVIYLHRHPADVLVSFYFHNKKFYDYKGDLTTFLRDMEYGREWSEYMIYWLSQRGTNLLEISYRELEFDTSIQLERIALFMGKDYCADKINRAVSNSNMTRMKTLESTKGLGLDSDTSIRFVREGGDRSRHLISRADYEQILRYNHNTLKLAGYVN